MPYVGGGYEQFKAPTLSNGQFASQKDYDYVNSYLNGSFYNPGKWEAPTTNYGMITGPSKAPVSGMGEAPQGSLQANPDAFLQQQNAFGFMKNNFPDWWENYQSQQHGKDRQARRGFLTAMAIAAPAIAGIAGAGAGATTAAGAGSNTGMAGVGGYGGSGAAGYTTAANAGASTGLAGVGGYAGSAGTTAATTAGTSAINSIPGNSGPQVGSATNPSFLQNMQNGQYLAAAKQAAPIVWNGMEYLNSRAAADDYQRMLEQALNSSDPFGPERAKYQKMLEEHMRNPEAFLSSPQVQFASEAAARKMASMGYNMSPAQSQAIADASIGQYYNQAELLAGLSGSQITPNSNSIIEAYNNTIGAQTRENAALGNLGRYAFDLMMGTKTAKPTTATDKDFL